MPYLILDPTDDYAARMMEFLGRRGLGGVALFSTPGHRHLWETTWRAKLGAYATGEHLVSRDALDDLARTLAREHPDGVRGLVPWDERHVLLAAELSDALGLGWNSREVVERFRDKSVLKAWLRERSALRLNRARVVSDAEGARGFQREVGAWPIVVKPSGGAGSMAVHFAGNDDELLAGCQAVLTRGLGEVLLEEYVGGTEYAVNGLVDHRGMVLITEVWRYDRRDFGDARNVYYETLKVSTHEEPFGDVARYAVGTMKALRLRRSPFHMEVKVDERGPCLIEVGARFAGGHQPVLGSLLHGRSLFELAACHFLEPIDLRDEDVDYARYDARSARILSGVQEEELERVERVLGVAEVEALPSHVGHGMLRRPGQHVQRSRDVNTKAWEVYLFHDDARQVAADAIAARRLLRYV